MNVSVGAGITQNSFSLTAIDVKEGKHHTMVGTLSRTHDEYTVITPYCYVYEVNRSHVQHGTVPREFWVNFCEH